MIPFIRSHSELMAITRTKTKDNANDINSSTIDSGQRKRYIRSLGEKIIELPDLPKTSRHKWIRSKEAVSKFFETLDYNNQIQSSYDLTLLARQSKNDLKDAA